jgi:hypothetical protein
MLFHLAIVGVVTLQSAGLLLDRNLGLVRFGYVRHSSVNVRHVSMFRPGFGYVG